MRRERDEETREVARERERGDRGWRTKRKYLGNKFDHALDNLPPSLISLWMDACTRFCQPLDFLPLSLSLLHLPPKYCPRSAFLPPLTSLFCATLEPSGTFRLPLSLRKITTKSQNFPHLQRTLHSIKLYCIDDE